jgi:putative addiction module component (TIGR02574 family)
MSQVVESLFASAMALSEGERLDLAAAILEATEPEVAGPIGEEWLAELQRRSDEIDAGTAKLIPWGEVKRDARARIVGR